MVRVIDSNATTWTPGDSWNNFYQYAKQDVVDAMFERGIKKLANKSSLKEAWEFLIPYQSGDLIAIKPNTIMAGDNDRKNNIYHVVSAIVYGLVDLMGIPPDKIAISDPSHLITQGGNAGPSADRMIDNCRHSEQLKWDLYGKDLSSTEIQFTDGHATGATHRLYKLYNEADHVICLPVLSWHSINAITGALKNLMGITTNMGEYHNSVSGGFSNSARFADYTMPIKDKLRLSIGEGLFGNVTDMNARPSPYQTLGGDGGKHPSSVLYFSRDIVALDSVMFDDEITERNAKGIRSTRVNKGFLVYAADDDHGLGTYEMKDTTGESTYNEIDFIDV